MSPMDSLARAIEARGNVLGAGRVPSTDIGYEARRRSHEAEEARRREGLERELAEARANLAEVERRPPVHPKADAMRLASARRWVAAAAAEMFEDK